MVKVGDKYIMEVAEVTRGAESGMTKYRIKGFDNLYFDHKGLSRLTTVDEDEMCDFIEKKIKEAQQDIYDFIMWYSKESLGNITAALHKINGLCSIGDIFEAYKGDIDGLIKDYKASLKDDTEFYVGDEVFNTLYACYGIITGKGNYSDGQPYYYVLYKDGSGAISRKEYLRLTGYFANFKSMLDTLGRDY